MSPITISFSPRSELCSDANVDCTELASLPLELDEILYEDAGDGVVEIILNRPDTLNAISGRSGGTRDQILHALAGAESDEAVGCIVLRGAGKAFSGGGDITGNAPRELPVDDLRFLEAVDAFHERIRSSKVPIVAAVHGYCLGAALVLAASCDVVIAGESTRFGFPEGRLGLVGASAIVPVVGRQWAKFLIMTGELLTAAQARDIGLVLAVEPDDRVHERARDLAARIARMPRPAVLLNRRTVDAVADAAGDAAGRVAAREGDAITLGMAAQAQAPDGRTFRAILDAEGMAGMKAARQAQYEEPWLSG
jgi:enoyl-CoA hydratase/carnithine racemase